MVAISLVGRAFHSSEHSTTHVKDSFECSRFGMPNVLIFKSNRLCIARFEFISWGSHTHTHAHTCHDKYRWQLCLLYWIYIPPPMANIARSNGLADQKLCRVLLSSVWSNIMNYQFIFSLVAHKSTSYYTCQLPYCFGCMLAVLVHSAMRCSVLVVCVCSWSIFVCWWSRWPNE